MKKSCKNSVTAKTPRQKLILGIIERDEDSIRHVIAYDGVNPMAELRKAIEARHGHARFLLKFVPTVAFPEVLLMAEHLERWGMYPEELSALNDWMADHE